MKILFVNYNNLFSNSGIHVINLANSLSRLGVECIVCVPQKKKNFEFVSDAQFEVMSFKEVIANRDTLSVDLIHFWTPREVTRKFSTRLFENKERPYVIHLEDNEDYLAEKFSRVPLKIIGRLPDVLQNLLIPNNISHPVKYKEFLRKANGITVIIDKLKEICPEGMPVKTI